jgi:hypothetical protein
MSIDVQVPPAMEVPSAPPVPSTRTRRPWLVAILSAFVVGALALAVVQTVSLSGVNEDLTASQGTVSNLEDKVSGLEGDLDLAEGAVDSLESEVAEQDTQLAACAQANVYSVKADKAFHAAVGQIVPAAFGGSDYAFDAALAKYRTNARIWAKYANQCEPGGGYSFS